MKANHILDTTLLVLAKLCKEPWGFTPDQLRKLTLDQLINFLPLAGKDTDKPLPLGYRQDEVQATGCYKNLFFDTWRERGLRDSEILWKWEVYKQEHPNELGLEG